MRVESERRPDMKAPPLSVSPLTVTALREANIKRGTLWHPTPESEWWADEWFMAYLGEVGEAADACKKLNRLSGGAAHIGSDEASLRHDLAFEIADAVIYLDLLAENMNFRAEFFEPYHFPFAERQDLPRSAKIITRLGIWTGHLGTAVERAMDARAKMADPNGSPDYITPSARKALRRCQKYLIILAQFYEIDLGAAIIWKFNAVSERYGFDVRLRPS